MKHVLENKIPPPIVGLGFGLLIYASSFGVTRFLFGGQAMIAIVVLMIGLGVAAFASIQFKQASTTVNPLKPDEASSLVVGGVFQYSRNPMYLGMALVLAAVTIFLGAWLGPVFLILFVVYISKYQIKPEEAAMAKLFGKEFASYCQSVRRWI